MSKLIIKDLAKNIQLDRELATKILGGINDWVRTYMRASSVTPPMNVFNISYNYTYVDNDYIMVQPQIFNIGTGVENSGTISYNVNSTTVSALSPVEIQA